MSATFNAEGQLLRVEHASGCWGHIVVNTGHDAPLNVDAIGGWLDKARKLKGCRVHISGELQSKPFNKRDGTRGVITSPICCELENLDPLCGSPQAAAKDKPRYSDGLDFSDSDIPL